jgi:hypothetical protein
MSSWKRRGNIIPISRKKRMVRETGPIARMLFEHELTIKIAEKIEPSMIE